MSKVLRPLEQNIINQIKSVIRNGIAYEVLGLGAGVQSSTLFLMNLLGLIKPKFEFAVFADTFQEKQGTYEYLDYLDELASDHSFPPIMRITAGNIEADMLNPNRQRYEHMPFYVDGGKKRPGMIDRKCTDFYKIRAINREVRKVFGMKQRRHWVGFTVDEIQRRNDDNFPQYITPRYPLLEMRMSRDDCKVWLKENGHPEPVKSSCVG